jgi:hypothetical protein
MSEDMIMLGPALRLKAVLFAGFFYFAVNDGLGTESFGSIMKFSYGVTNIFTARELYYFHVDRYLSMIRFAKLCMLDMPCQRGHVQL